MRTVDPVKHEAKRRHILAAAAHCFSRKGFERTTTAEICRTAGISSGSLFHYFPNKKAIFRAIFEQDARDNEARIAEVRDSADPVAAVLELVEHMTRPLLDDPGAAGLVNEVIAQAPRDPELAEQLGRNDFQVRQGLVELLERAVADGRIDAELDLWQTTGWISALVDSVYARLSMEPDLDPHRELATVKLILTRFLRVEP
ncbi:TetR/AcrR family transcriptional regulator [Saccharopolyspora taberi]|uniref:HTH tetR-type domain-containing protein n=1 Tax=Saccharopolyspora taberi TaxID=60895 RepID=A0ABN3VBA2_9PSEU